MKGCFIRSEDIYYFKTKKCPMGKSFCGYFADRFSDLYSGNGLYCKYFSLDSLGKRIYQSKTTSIKKIEISCGCTSAVGFIAGLNNGN